MLNRRGFIMPALEHAPSGAVEHSHTISAGCAYAAQACFQQVHSTLVKQAQLDSLPLQRESRYGSVPSAPDSGSQGASQLQGSPQRPLHAGKPAGCQQCSFETWQMRLDPSTAATSRPFLLESWAYQKVGVEHGQTKLGARRQ